MNMHTEDYSFQVHSYCLEQPKEFTLESGETILIPVTQVPFVAIPWYRKLQKMIHQGRHVNNFLCWPVERYLRIVCQESYPTRHEANEIEELYDRLKGDY